MSVPAWILVLAACRGVQRQPVLKLPVNRHVPRKCRIERFELAVEPTNVMMSVSEDASCSSELDVVAAADGLVAEEVSRDEVVWFTSSDPVLEPDLSVRRNAEVEDPFPSDQHCTRSDNTVRDDIRETTASGVLEAENDSVVVKLTANRLRGEVEVYGGSSHDGQHCTQSDNTARGNIRVYDGDAVVGDVVFHCDRNGSERDCSKVMEDDIREDAEENSSSWETMNEGDVENGSVALKLTANHFQSDAENGPEVVKLTMDYGQREVAAATKVNAADIAVSYEILLQKDRKAKPFVVHEDKVKSFHGDPPPSWLEPVRGPSAPSPAATTEACADPTGLYDFMTQRRKSLPSVPTRDDQPAAVSDHPVDAPATSPDLDLNHDVHLDIVAAPAAGATPLPVRKWRRKPARLKDYNR